MERQREGYSVIQNCKYSCTLGEALNISSLLDAKFSSTKLNNFIQAIIEAVYPKWTWECVSGVTFIDSTGII